jgi:histidine phosphotransferase ChpT
MTDVLTPPTKIMAKSLDAYVLELMASRMCHDIISPVGAITNGIELMTELGPDNAHEAAALIAQSAEQANRRLRMFRYAYGASGSRAMVDIKDLRQVAFAYFEGTRSVLEWPETFPPPVSDLPRGLLKTILNLLVLGGEMVTKAGLLKLRALNDTANNGPINIEIQVSGDGANFREGMEAALQGTIEPQDLDPRLVHAYITGALARHYGLKIGLQKALDANKISFLLSEA